MINRLKKRVISRINKIILKWETLNYIFESFFGKVLFIFSLITFSINFSINYIIEINQFYLSAIAMLFFFSAYLFYVIFIPEVIKNYRKDNYVEFMLKRSKEKELSEVTEFSFMKNVDVNIEALLIYSSNTENFMKKQELINESDKSIDKLYQKSIIKYEYLSEKYFWVRFLITLLLAIFIGLFYFTTIKNYILYIMGV